MQTTGRERGFQEAAQGAVFWTAAGTTFVSALFLGANRPVFWVVLSATAIALFVIQCLIDLRRGPSREDTFFLLRTALPWLLVVGWAVFQSLPSPWPGLSAPQWSDAGIAPGRVSTDPVNSAQGALRLLAYGCLFWIAFRAGRSRRRAIRFIASVAVWVFLTAVYGVFAATYGWNPIAASAAYEGAVTSSFVNKNAYAFYAGIGLLATISALASIAISVRGARSEGAVARGWQAVMSRGGLILVAAIVLPVALVLTESRAGVAATLVAAVLLVAMLMPRGARRTWVFLAGVSLLTIAALIVVFASVLGGVEDGQGLAGRAVYDDPAKDARWTVYALVIEGILQRPIQGHGLGAFADAFRPFATREIGSKDWDFAHSTYLQLAFELGIPAAVLLLGALVSIGARLAAGVKARDRLRPVPAFALAALALATLHSTVDFSAEMPANAALLALVLGVGAAQCTRSGSGRDPQFL